MRILIAGVLLSVLLIPQFADAQTTVDPVDRAEITQSTSTATPNLGAYSSYVQNPTAGTQYRLFFEFDLSAYGSQGSVVFNFSAYEVNGTGTIYLRAMNAGEDGSITASDWYNLGATLWTGTITSSSQSFSVPVTAWFNNRAGGFGGLALTAAPGTVGVVSTNAGSGQLALTAVPEPATFALFGLGLGGLFLGHRMRRRRKQKTA